MQRCSIEVWIEKIVWTAQQCAVMTRLTDDTGGTDGIGGISCTSGTTGGISCTSGTTGGISCTSGTGGIGVSGTGTASGPKEMQ